MITLKLTFPKYHKAGRITGCGSESRSAAVHGSGNVSRWCALLAILLFGTLISARAGDFTSDFEQANKLFEQSRFTESVAAYERLLANGLCSAELYFNLGNALLKSGQTGRAIVSYRLAERLAPRDPDLQANLKFARDSASGGTPDATDFWWLWLGTLSLDEWTRLTAAALWLWLTLAVLGLWKPALKKPLRGYLNTIGVFGVLLAVCLTAVTWEQAQRPRAVVIVREAVVRYGPLDESQGAFTARDGAELVVRDKKGPWLWVTDASGKFGWVRHEQVHLLTATAGLYHPPPPNGSR